jgi:hypothetical protein
VLAGDVAEVVVLRVAEERREIPDRRDFGLPRVATLLRGFDVDHAPFPGPFRDAVAVKVHLGLLAEQGDDRHRAEAITIVEHILTSIYLPPHCGGDLPTGSQAIA